MKKIVLGFLLISNLAVANESILGEFTPSKNDTPTLLNVDVGSWYISWHQKSTSSDFLQYPTDALKTSYNIDDALAWVIKADLHYKYLSAGTKYYNTGRVHGLSSRLSLLKLIPYLNIDFRYTKAHFNGDITSSLKSGGALSTGEFNSDLQIMDIVAYPFNDYLGLGYRIYTYDVPQDVYLINNTTNETIEAGLVDVKYEGDFYTVVFENSKKVSQRKNYNGLLYSFVGGIGKLKPKTDGFDKWTSESDATFYDIKFGYSYKSQFSKAFGAGFGIGYRYNKINTKYNKSDNAYSLVTEFNSEFCGPFINANINF